LYRYSYAGDVHERSSLKQHKIEQHVDNTFDKMYYPEGDLIAGIDESGVSDIAGPLVAACVILPKIDIHRDDLRIFEIDDSKQIPEKYRKGHAEVIWQTALGIGIGECLPSEIDFLGRLESIRLAMYRAISACKTPKGKDISPNYILVDKVDKLKLSLTIPHRQIEGGDTKSLCIAAASIVAKVYRDDIMIRLHERFPWYGWISNKGYPCKNHFEGLDSHGIQLGVHRTRRWPFKRSPKLQEDRKLWDKRRLQWRMVTARTLQKEAAEELIYTKDQS
jgi:ribonuclease HII